MDRSSGRSWARMKYSPHFWFGSFGCCLTRALGQYQASLGFRDQDWKLNVLANDMRKGFWNSGTSRHRPLHDQRRPLNLCRSLQSFPCIGFLINRTQKNYTSKPLICVLRPYFYNSCTPKPPDPIKATVHRGQKHDQNRCSTNRGAAVS